MTTAIFPSGMAHISAMLSPASRSGDGVGRRAASGLRSSASSLEPPSIGNPVAKAAAARSFGKLPLSFEPNQGQYDASVRFASHASGCSFLSTDDGMVISFADGRSVQNESAKGRLNDPALPEGRVVSRPMWSKFSPAVFQKRSLRARTLHMQLAGTDPHATTSGEERLPGAFNYMIGADPAKWRTGVPSYGRLRTKGIYKGVDVSYYGNQNKLEYDFIIHPGATPAVIKMSYAGCSGIRVDRNGDLVVSAPWGEIREARPESYQIIGGKRVPVVSAYSVGKGFVGFRLGSYDRSRDLVIDPILAYSTLLGGTGGAAGNSIAVDSSGAAYVTGSNFSSDFPVVNQGQPYPSEDIFVSELNAEGTALVYSTLIGGTGGDTPNAIAVDDMGSAYVTGYTFSSDFPTVNPLQPALSGEIDAFVTKFSPDGSSLVYSTYLGGTGSDYAFGIAVDQSFNAIVAGQTFSSNFPTAVAAQGSKAGELNGFVSKLNPSGSALVFSTYIGGSTDDACSSVATDAGGSVYVTGGAQSPDFPLLNSVQPAFISTTLVKTSDAARAWQSSIGGLPVNVQVTCLAVDPKDPSIVFAGTINNGVFRSEDAGATWSETSAPVVGSTSSIVVDPVSPSNVYLSRRNSQFVSRSTDGGNTWVQAGGVNSGLINALALDPSNPSTIYAAAGGGLFESEDRGSTFEFVDLGGLGDNPFDSIAISSFTPQTILVGSGRGLIRSVDGGADWGLTGLFDQALALAIPSKSVAYAGTVQTGLAKSTDNGFTWKTSLQTDHAVTAIAVAPGSTKIVYAAIFNDGVFKSTNGGVSWSAVNQGLSAPFVNAIAADPSNKSVLYAGSASVSHPFVVKLSPTGALLFSTLVGGEGYDAGLGIAVDNTGNVWLTGVTFSKSFPTVNGIQPANAGSFDAFVAKLSGSVPSILFWTYFGGSLDDSGASIAVAPDGNAYIAGGTFSTDLHVVSPSQPASGGSQDAFVLSLDSSGAISYSTYLGGQFIDLASSIAVDGNGDSYLTGQTVSSNFPTTPGVLKGAPTQQFELDAFVTKIAAPSHSLVITGAAVSGNALTVFGEQFNIGAVVLVNGQAQKTRNDAVDPATKLVAKKAGKAIPVGAQVMLQVQDAGGALSPAFPFTR
ncbi:MAG TPA: SBBP repeat-containing protein [Blastocatellia bacterium]|nr:SBBP repeat-containing protein [Blastocatellia bacterium]